MLEEAKAHGIIIIAIELITFKVITVLDKVEGYPIYDLAINIGHGLNLASPNIKARNIIKIIVVIDGHFEIKWQNHTDIQTLPYQLFRQGTNNIRQTTSFDKRKTL